MSIVLILCVIFIILIIAHNNTYDNQEHYTANNLENIKRGLLVQDVNDNVPRTFVPFYKKGIQPGSDIHKELLALNYIDSSYGMLMIRDIHGIIIDKIIEYARACSDMNGADGMSDGKINMTLACVNDPYVLEEDTNYEIAKYIIRTIRKMFNITMTPYIVIADLMRHLNLLEAVIYPLQFSGLYTIHGIQYTNRNMIKRMVETNLKVKDVLYTILSRRNIIIRVDTDQQMY